MANCAQVVHKIQAFVDGELSPAQRVICEQHLDECRACRSAFRDHQRLSASLFESFAPCRLQHDLSQRVLENLPTLMTVDSRDDMESLNWRAKHARESSRWVARVMPMAMVAMVLILAAIIRFQWPAELKSSNAIGVVLQTAGAPTLIPVNATERESIEPSALIENSSSFETGVGESLMLALAGHTMVKLNHDTRVSVENERLIRMEQGEAFFDVGHDDRLFKVRTAVGTVTVFGTAFNVSVKNDIMTVAVARGTVQIDNNNGHFQPLQAGELSTVIGQSSPSTPQPVDADGLTRWANLITPNEEATRMFASLVVARDGNPELPAKIVYMVDVSKSKAGIGAIRLEWFPEPFTEGYCSYDMYVYNEDAKPIFKHTLDGQALANNTAGSLTVNVPETPIRNAKVLSIRLVPNPQLGGHEAKFSGVWAVPQ